MLPLIIHDLNNSLAVINGNLQLLKMCAAGELSEEKMVFVNRAISAGQEIREMLDDLTDITRMEKGEIELNREVFNLADITKEVVEEKKGFARNYEVTLTLENAGALPSVYADKKMIRRVIANLVKNALKSTPPKGAVRVKSFYNKNVPAVGLEIEDAGDIIPTEYLDKIFDKLIRLESPKIRSGCGLGLPFCKMAIEAHQGKIRVESQPETGTVFIFTLPLSKMYEPGR